VSAPVFGQHSQSSRHPQALAISLRPGADPNLYGPLAPYLG
jgi:hypothetical protein